MKKVVSFALASMLLAGSASAQTLLYLDFDQTSDLPAQTDGNAYTPSTTAEDYSTALGAGPLTFTFRNNAGDGPEVADPPAGLSGTAQGGRVLLVDSGSGQDEGLEITGTNGLATEDVTLEVVWFTNDASGGTNTVGIQSPLGNEWPFGEKVQLFMRTVGADRMDWWSDVDDGVQDTTVGVNADNTWYHDVIVFDYNDGDPANSTLEGFRNGTSVGTYTYDASAISSTLFPAGNAGTRKYAVGYHNSLDAAPGDHRGLNGGVDAIAISVGTLTPGSGAGTFVLPDGNDIEEPSSVSDWMMF